MGPVDSTASSRCGSSRRSPPKGIPGQMRNPPPPDADFPRLVSIGPAKGVQGPRRKNRDVKRDYDRTRFPPSPLERNCQQFFRPRRAKSSWKHAPLTLIRSPRIYLSTDSCVRACVRRSEAPTVALRPRILRNRESRCARFQPRIYERLRLRLRKDRGDTNLLETFSTRDARVRERERGREIRSGGRSRRTGRACVAATTGTEAIRFVFEEILLRIERCCFIRKRTIKLGMIS